VLVVRSSHASTWHLAQADPAPPAPAQAVQPSLAQASPKKAATTKPRRCKVPRLRGMSLTAARKALTKAGCKLGTVQRKRRPSGKAGRVLAQKVPPGRSLRAGARVGVVLISRSQR